MKYVRENINEKFVEDSDPIHDMGIGISTIINKIKKYVVKHYTWMDTESVEDSDIAEYCIENLKDKDTALTVFNYLLGKGVFDDDELCGLLVDIINYGKKDRNVEMMQAVINKQPAISVYVYEDLRDADYEDVANGEIIKKMIYDYLDKIANTDKNILTHLLVKAAKKNNTNEVITLINKGANPSVQKHIVLREAIKFKNKTLVNFLMKHLEADVDYK